MTLRESEPRGLVGERYTLLEPISRGAMGAVYRGVAEAGNEVAIKRLVDERQANRFEIEGRLLSRLRHPRVVRVIDCWTDASGSYLAMDLVEGKDLARILREQGNPGLPVDQALRYGLQACEALQYVHEEHIVHRDVKPENLIAGDDGLVLVDFGIAREVDELADSTRGVGTPRFMAPEVLVGESASPRSDVYSLGATVWALITGTPPVYEDATALAETVPGVSAQLEETLRGALELKPERRIASIEAFAAALGSPLGASSGASLAVSVPRPAAQRSLLEAIVRTAAGVFEAAAASVALTHGPTGELVYQAAWGAGAEEIVGVRLARGSGIAGAVVSGGAGMAIADCRSDARFAAQIAAGTGYVPHTMLVAPLVRDGVAVGALSVLDRRDGGAYGPSDLVRADLFAELTVVALPAPSEPQLPA